jgi:hypothetical protein
MTVSNAVGSDRAAPDPLEYLLVETVGVGHHPRRRANCSVFTGFGPQKPNRRKEYERGNDNVY